FSIEDPGFVVIRVLESQAAAVPKLRSRRTGKEAPKPKKSVGRKENKAKQSKEKKHKRGASDKNPLDHLKPPDSQFLTPGCALKATLRLVRQALQQVASEHADSLVLHNVRLDREYGTVRAAIEAWPGFSQAEEELKLRSINEAGGSAEPQTDACERLVSFSFPLQAAEDEDSVNDEQPQSPTVDEADSPCKINLRFTPALRLPFDSCSGMSSEGSSGDNVDDSAYAAPPGTSS
uniref:Alba domain-containing protein n=1 Tax=Macrostomum lignano TaxID=282301 RepID=A0A1I8JG64_9PLAT